MKKLIKNKIRGHNRICRKAQIAERYYQRKNDVLNGCKKQDEKGNPLRTADNRIPSNFYNLLVNQKAAYMFTAPPLFDTGNKALNKEIVTVLGDQYPKICKDLCIHASNAAVAWIHCWIEENGTFRYGVIDSKQVIPLWDTGIDKKLTGVLRVYDVLDEDGFIYNIYEFWDSEKCYAYRKKNRDSYNGLEEYKLFHHPSISCPELFDESNIYEHGFGEVPFLPFFNNGIVKSDLDSVKDLIDCYDKVFSGFMNDLEDIQEIIFVLTNYGGEDLGEFLKRLKKYKAIEVEEDRDGKGDVKTLAIDIPVEARNIMLSMTRKAIFEQGQGIDPDPQNFGNSSGVALRYLYSLLELKAGLMETEFRLGFGKLVRMICHFLGQEPESIIQIWTRTSVSNDAELAEIAQKSVGVISNKTIIKNHPWVEDPEKEEKQLQKEAEEKAEQFNPYSAAFEKPKDPSDKGQSGGDVDGEEA